MRIASTPCNAASLPRTDIARTRTRVSSSTPGPARSTTPCEMIRGGIGTKLEKTPEAAMHRNAAASAPRRYLDVVAPLGSDSTHARAARKRKANARYQGARRYMAWIAQKALKSRRCRGLAIDRRTAAPLVHAQCFQVR